MKKFVRIFAVAALFSFGICSLSKAEIAPIENWTSVTLAYSNGKGTNAVVGGKSDSEMWKDLYFLIEYYCN
jgi:hypothetical protein